MRNYRIPGARRFAPRSLSSLAHLLLNLLGELSEVLSVSNEVGVVHIDSGLLHGDDSFDVFGGGHVLLPQNCVGGLDDAGLERRVFVDGGDGRGKVADDVEQLGVDELDALEGRIEQATDVAFDEGNEGGVGDEEGSADTGHVANEGLDLVGSELF